jgi:hypothetical protein
VITHKTANVDEWIRNNAAYGRTTEGGG